MDSKDAQHLGSVLKAMLKQRGLEAKVREAAIPDYWREIVGPAGAKVSEIRRLSNGTLYVEVSASVWRSEMLLRREEIRRKLNELMGGEFVREIILK